MLQGFSVAGDDNYDAFRSNTHTKLRRGNITELADSDRGQLPRHQHLPQFDSRS